MRSWWLAAKIAAVFMTVMMLFVALTLHLFMRGVMHADGDMMVAHDAFVVTVLQFAAGAMVLIVAFAFYITAPLRRMSRSMDRIAAGELDHRVVVRGRDEGAAMGRSFNAMAERVSGMIVGQKELMAGVSHELRSPLARMRLSLELMREGKGDAAERIAELQGDVDALDSLVQELLLASRFDLGSVPLELETLDLAELGREAWARVALEAEKQGTVLVTTLADDAGSVRADRALAVRLLGNLFENAVRHGGPGTVALTSTRRTDRITVAVSDEGPGVEDADLDRLFEPFFRADRSRSRRTGAGGLGLMIVRRAVEAHGGSVKAVPAESRGLAVELDLPAV